MKEKMRFLLCINQSWNVFLNNVGDTCENIPPILPDTETTSHQTKVRCLFWSEHTSDQKTQNNFHFLLHVHNHHHTKTITV